jgi:hypothetical protein
MRGTGQLLRRERVLSGDSLSRIGAAMTVPRIIVSNARPVEKILVRARKSSGYSVPGASSTRSRLSRGKPFPQRATGLKIA